MSNRPVQYGSGPIPPRVFMAMQVVHAMQSRLTVIAQEIMQRVAIAAQSELPATQAPLDGRTAADQEISVSAELDLMESRCYEAALETVRTFVAGEDACAPVQASQGNQ